MSYIRSLRFKIMLLTVVPLVFVAIGYIAISKITSSVLQKESTRSIVVSAADTVGEQIEQAEANMLSFATLLSNHSDALKRAIAEGDRAAIFDICDAYAQALPCDSIAFANAQGQAIARLDDREAYGDDVSASPVIADALAGKSVSYTAPTLGNGLSVAAAVPVTADDGQTVGVVYVSKRLDTASYLATLRDITGCDIALYMGDALLLSSEGAAFEGALASDVHASVSDQRTAMWSAQRSGRAYEVQAEPLRGRDGAAIGAVVVQHAVVDAAWINILWACVFLASVAVLFPIISPCIRSIIVPIRKLAEQAKQVAQGNVRTEVAVKRRDEIGQLQQSFFDLVESMREQSDALERIADGDFTVEFEPRSAEDSVGLSLARMLERNNDSFRRLSDSTQQVAAITENVANASQMLAQGAVEQNRALDDVASGMVQIEEKTDGSARLAQQAADLTQHAGEQITSSMEKMLELTTAMNEIAGSSEMIAKVIKVIEDIAFQTNILALNASVEAARAGTHGKGFAVVADEVRNLAAKSASAAGETADIIRDSMSRVSTGTALVGDMRERLETVTDTTSRVVEFVERIAVASRDQSESIQSINRSLGQVTDVVQTNSASAQQSAASSQVMAQQATLLRELVERYRIRTQAAG